MADKKILIPVPNDKLANVAIIVPNGILLQYLNHNTPIGNMITTQISPSNKKIKLMNININDKVVMKKPHACGENKWIVTRVGVDIKIKCVHCGRSIMMDRTEFNKKLKKVEEY